MNLSSLEEKENAKAFFDLSRVIRSLRQEKTV
jgi:hypothetical protein